MRAVLDIFGELMVQGAVWVGAAAGLVDSRQAESIESRANQANAPVVVATPAPNATAQSVASTFAGAAPQVGATQHPRSMADLLDSDEHDGQIVDPRSLNLGGMFNGNGYTAQVVKVGQLPSFGLARAAKYYEVKITTATAFTETFLVQPSIAPRTQPMPLVVAFHKYGNSQRDIVKSTTLETQAAIRGWHLLAPLGASKFHYSSIDSQINTEAAIDWMFANFTNIDPTRIYGVGFSMGGGAVMNYAARHLDPQKAMFAAVVDHSGGVALKDTQLYESGNTFVMLVFDFWFGNGTTGSAEPWKMARSSVINFDDVSLQVETDADLARNLLHMGVWITRASDDTITYLTRQSDVLDQHLLSLGMQVGPKYAYTIVPYTGHSWDMLDENAVCDWLATQSLTLPTTANTLADRDGKYFHFEVTQDAGGAFTPFTWTIDVATNQLTLAATSNLQRISVSLPDVGLSIAQPLIVNLGTADGLPDIVVLKQVTVAPTIVLRDTISESSWSYDSFTQELTVVEYDGGAHVWEVQP